MVKGAAAVLVLLIASPAGAAIWRCPQSNGGVMFTDQAEADDEHGNFGSIKQELFVPLDYNSLGRRFHPFITGPPVLRLAFYKS